MKKVTEVMSSCHLVSSVWSFLSPSLPGVQCCTGMHRSIRDCHIPLGRHCSREDEKYCKNSTKQSKCSQWEKGKACMSGCMIRSCVIPCAWLILDTDLPVVV